ncbi:MAG: sodium:solute symporter [Candidatus Aminicenantes bacterium]|nr:sodium:solute symporter [Candidatus Aminicenantes bacterium]
MSLGWLDWGIVLVTLFFMVYGVVFSKRFMRSVADFLAAGRSAGRYLMTVSLGMAMLGAISVIGEFEVFFKSGFCLKWWELSMALAILLVTVSGWIIYRFRQTRALTLAQFFEMRYSRNFRVFAGILAFVSGIINFGIFPAVGARFFIYYMGLPAGFEVWGIHVSTFVLMMTVLLGIAIFFVFSGGQVAVIIADFIQGVFSNFVFVLLIFFFLLTIEWSQIFEALSIVPREASMVNPFKTGQVEDFNFWYFLIGLVGFVYNFMSWQGTQAYNSSAKSAHEAKMSKVLENWRNYPRNLFLMFLPVIAFVVLNHPDFSHIAGKVGSVIGTVGSPEIQSQLRVPLVLRFILPVGLAGAFAAVMLAAFLSTHDTYLHSWGSIFIQDIVMPFRKKPFSPVQHIRLLRLAVIGVAVFIFFFSLIFQQTQHIYLFFAITAAIFVGGSGAVIIGGLYWKRGTTAAAWSAMITGSTISVGGIILHQVIEDFPINGQWFWGLSMVAASLVYVLVSLLGRVRDFDLDKLLHRGKYEVKGEIKIIDAAPSRGWKVLGMGKEFTRGDKAIYILSYAWILIWTLIFIGGTVFNLTHDVSDSGWMKYWKVYVVIYAAVSLVIVVWFTIGGIRDMRSMFKQLGRQKRDDMDDGFVTSTPGKR